MTFSEADLKDWQVDGVNFLVTPDVRLNNKPHKLLADDPGLGKTPMTICALKRIKAKRVIIFCPATIKKTWAKQLVNWGFCEWQDIQIVDSLTADTIYGKRVLVLNYDLVQRKTHQKVLNQLMKNTYDVFIADEAQRLKGVDSYRSQVILGGLKDHKIPLIARANHIWFLSGTIAPNRPVELYPILASCAPECLKPSTGYRSFAEYYCDAYWDGQELVAKGAKHIEQLHENLKPFMLKRRIEDVYPEMPPVLIKDVYVDVDMASDETNTNTAKLRSLIGLAKVPFCVEYVKDKLQERDKILVIAFSRKVVEALNEQLPGSVRIYGGMTTDAKERAKQEFIENPDCHVLIGQINTMGEGVDDLQSMCDYIVSCEEEWSPGLYEQMFGRLRRIGQKSASVILDQIIASDTFDGTMGYSRKKKDKVLKQLLRTNTKGASMLEQVLERIAVALEKITSNIPANGAINEKPAEEKKAVAAKPKKEKAATPTLDDVLKTTSETLERLTGYLGDEGKAKAEVSALVKALGSDKVKNLKPENFNKFLSDLKDLESEVLTADTDAETDDEV